MVESAKEYGYDSRLNEATKLKEIYGRPAEIESLPDEPPTDYNICHLAQRIEYQRRN